MNREALNKLLYTMTDEEIQSKEGIYPEQGTLGALDAGYLREGDVYVFMESDLEHAPVLIPSYESTSKHFNTLNIVAGKHVRYSEVPMHRHEFIEMNYVLSGHIRIIINGVNVEIKQGDLCIMDSDVKHKILTTEENDLMLNILMPKSYFNMTFLTTFMDMDLVSRFFTGVLSEKNKHDQYLLFHCQESEAIRMMIESVFCEFLEPVSGSSSAIRYYIGLILIEAVRCYQKTLVKENRKKSDYLTEILKYIDEHCDHCTLKGVAERFNYSPSHLSKKLKKSVGKPFQELVSEQRLNRVTLQLENTQKPISDIAVGCGYQNLAFFYRKFQQRYKVTPNEYRQRSNKMTSSDSYYV